MSRLFHPMRRPVLERVNRFDDWFCQRLISDDHLPPQVKILSERSFYLVPSKILSDEAHLVDEGCDDEALPSKAIAQISIYLDKKEDGLFFSLFINLPDRKYKLANIPNAEDAKEKLEFFCKYKLPKAVMQSILNEVDAIKKKYIDIAHEETCETSLPTYFSPTRFS